MLRCQPGREEVKKLWKWVRTLREPGVPGTRGMRMGDRSAPVAMSKSASVGRRRDLRELVERGVKAVQVVVRRRTRRTVVSHEVGGLVTMTPRGARELLETAGEARGCWRGIRYS